ncbi:MAG: tRNA-dihydrouridine synthase family protein [archaeon]|jgi:nifR3 family TIM-barrel protein
MKKIGSLKLAGELFLAPMADYTNVAFRTLAKENGAALVYTELISSKAILMKSKRTVGMLAVSDSEKPVFLQLFGSNPSDFKKAIEIVEKKFPENFVGYDLNSGCSVPKAIKGKYGSSIMNNPINVGEIISAMKSATNKPITIKMRLGLDKQTFLEVANEVEKANVDAITLHPRMGTQGYSGNADWTKIALLREKVSVPLIGNGDIRSPEDVLRMKKETKCDFEMIGRATMGDAFFFKQANALLLGKSIPLRTKKEILLEAKRFLELVKEFSLKPNDARPYFISLAKGFEGAAVLRNKFGLSKTIEEMEKHLLEYFSDN